MLNGLRSGLGGPVVKNTAVVANTKPAYARIHHICVSLRPLSKTAAGTHNDGRAPDLLRFLLAELHEFFSFLRLREFPNLVEIWASVRIECEEVEKEGFHPGEGTWPVGGHNL